MADDIHPDTIEVIDLLAEAERLDPKRRLKAMRTVFHHARQAARSAQELTLDDIAVLLPAIDAAAPSLFDTSESAWISASLRRRHRELLGMPSPEIAREKAITLDVEAANVIVFDPQRGLDGWSLTTLNDGLHAIGNLGFDGRVEVRMRVLRAGQPEPQDRELCRVRVATPPMRVLAPSGQLAVTGCGRHTLVLDAPSEDNVVVMYGMATSRPEDVLIVVAERGTFDVPPFTDVPDLPLVS